ncbi:hypothetical protein RJD28_08645 [Oscillospiraceae bacterium NTUH-002-81]|nr:hypothetical protein RJD28_08645 [Oscillospiraceae bacterium NTUH-002-81]
MTQYETTEAQENGICGKENGGGRGIDGFWLKMLAVVTMLIDHIGAIFFPGRSVDPGHRPSVLSYLCLPADGGLSSHEKHGQLSETAGAFCLHFRAVF